MTLEHIQQMVEELRSGYESLIAGETIAAPAHIRAIVTEWSTSVLPAIDARISRCHDLIKRGLCSEAIDYALESPNLFEAVKLLDLERFGRANYSAWMDASRAAGLLLPAAPQLEKFADIEAAHDRLVEMRPLLERWRRMNIQRVPLPQRIRMLRDLQMTETGCQSLVWQAMLRDHEAHRLMEIKAGLSRMREQLSRDGVRDIAELEREVEAMHAELQEDWSSLRPPPEVGDQAIKILVETRQRKVDATIDGLVPQLEAAHAELASDRGGAKAKLLRLHDGLNQALIDRGVLNPGDVRVARMRPILEYTEWVRDIDRLTREVSQLVGERPVALKARLVWADELNRMMDRIDTVASRLPPEDIDPARIRELSGKVGDASEAVRFESRTKRILFVSTISAVVIGGALCVWAVYASRQHEAGIQAAVAATVDIIKQIEAGKDRGAAPADGWSVSVQRDPRVAAAIERVTQARRKHADRAAAFVKHLGDIASALADLQKEKRPDPLAPWPEAFARATDLLATARNSLAVVDDDRAKLEQPSAMLRAKAKEYGEAADDAFEAEVNRLGADISSIGQTIVDQPARTDQLLPEAEAALAKLRGIAAAVACPQAAEGYESRKIISQAVAGLVAANSKVAIALNELRTRRGVIAGIADRENHADQLLASGRYPEYADLIRSIGEDVGAGATSRDYVAVARDHLLWQAVADWQRFIDSLASPVELNAKKAADALGRLRAVSAESLRFGEAKEAKQWLEPILEQLATNTDEKFEELKGKFNAKLESQHGVLLDAVVQEKAESPPQPEYPRYYCLSKDRPLPDKEKTIKYVNGRPDKTGQWPTTSLRFDPERYQVSDSPQKIIALACKRILETAPHAGFAIERLGGQVLQQCASLRKPSADRIAIDPCLQAILLRFLVVDACDASPFLRKHLARSLKLVDAGKMSDDTPRMLAGVDNAVFTAVLDPAKQDDEAWVRDDRVKCDAFVRLVADEAANVMREVDALDRLLAKNLAAIRQFRCVGRLRRLSGGGWTISGGDAEARAGKQVFVAGGPQDDHKMLPFLTCDNTGQVPPGSNVKARAGDPVFVEVIPGKAG